MILNSGPNTHQPESRGSDDDGIRRTPISPVTPEDLIQLASHELRTPLNTIRVDLVLLRRGIEDADQCISCAEYLLRLIRGLDAEVTHMAKLLERLLDTAQIRNTRDALRLERFDVTQLAHELAARVRTRTDWHIELEVESPQVGEWDYARVERILDNLVTNALKYGAPPITIAIDGDEAGVRMRVSDHGTGMPEDEIDRMFEKFVRGRSATGNGFGLGLWIVKSFVHSMGGKIEAGRNDAGGLTMCVELPRTSPG